MLFSRLQDNVAPVREAAAIALGCVVSTYGELGHSPLDQSQAVH